MKDLELSSFSTIKAWLASFEDQTQGDACAICQTGESYLAFKAVGLARPDDVEIIEQQVAAQFCHLLRPYLEARRGRIYWRVPFEWDISNIAVVSRFDALGPDRDFLTDRPCYLDRNWKRVACYARLYRASLPTMESVKLAVAS